MIRQVGMLSVMSTIMSLNVMRDVMCGVMSRALEDRLWLAQWTVTGELQCFWCCAMTDILT